MNLPQTGGCQCGKVRYEITQKPLLVYTCHCLDCQRLTSSAFSLGVVVPEAGFRLAGIDPRPLKRSPIAGGDAKNSLACQKRASLGLDRSAGRAEGTSIRGLPIPPTPARSKTYRAGTSS